VAGPHAPHPERIYIPDWQIKQAAAPPHPWGSYRHPDSGRRSLGRSSSSARLLPAHATKLFTTLAAEAAKLSEPLGALAIIALIVLGAVVLVASGNLLADHLFKRLQKAVQHRIDQRWKEELAIRALYAPWIDAHPGQWYTIKWGDREMRIRSKGTSRKLSELPKQGNQIGDFYNIEGQTHFFVWMVLDRASTLSWVDP
jgi:hypothetical protein